ncbi:hypothetical protein [Embleya sp. NPDC020630]|uniref:hypothetical protein n=1 Tax=Embleya sp. NPDC020630 TaxID=3363979 RepID=UPI0037BAC6F0
MDKEKCSTMEHISLEYAAKKGLKLARINWAHVIRDSIYGIVIAMIVAAFIAFVFGPIPAGGFVGLIVLVELIAFVWRLVSGHAPGCSAKLATLTVFGMFDSAF